MAEYDDRARRRSERQIKATASPRDESLRSLDIDGNPATMHALATCDWVRTPAVLADRRLRYQQEPLAQRTGAALPAKPQQTVTCGYFPPPYRTVYVDKSNAPFPGCSAAVA